MSFQPIATGHKQADQIAKEHGERIVSEKWSITQIKKAFGCSEYCARRVRVACGLTTADPAVVTRRRRAKARVAEERRALQTPDGDDTKGNAYEMDTLSGEYVFTFPRSRNTPPKRMSKKAVNQLIMDYSNAGGKMTRSELATAWGIPRWMAIAMLQALGIVKASVPFSEESVQEAIDKGAVATLDARWLAATKQQVEARVEKRKNSDLARDAQRWRESRMYTFEWAKGATAELAEAVKAWEKTQPLRHISGTGGEKVTLVLGVSDLHYGAYAWSQQSGTRWDRQVCRDRLASAIDSVFQRLPADIIVDRIVLPIGSDMAHVDNVTGATTKGTPQDMDGTPEQMVHELWLLVHTVVLSLAERAPVDLWLMEANHDHILGHALFASLAMAFKESERVTIRRDASAPLGPYQVGKYGKTLLGFAHGDGRSTPQDLSAIMAQQAPKLWGQTDHHIWLTGHRHVHSVREEHGVEVHVLPSLSGTDRYHQKRWPMRQEPRLKALVLHETDGLIASLFGKPRV